MMSMLVEFFRIGADSISSRIARDLAPHSKIFSTFSEAGAYAVRE
jgi:hypothetical protein